MTIRSATDFIQKFDQARWSLAHPFSRKGNGKIDKKETGLRYNSVAPKTEFIKDLGGLSDEQFKVATAAMTDDAVKAYLYNKYPDFFLKWDSGKTRWGGTWQITAMDGSVDSHELWVGGGINSMVADAKTMIKEPRDRALLGRIRLLLGRGRDAALRAEMQKSAPIPDQTATRASGRQAASNVTILIPIMTDPQH